jgi:transposase
MRRVMWRAEAIGLNPRKIVFIDETACKTNMMRLRGWAIRGERLIDKVPHGHWKTTTMIAALGSRGMRCAKAVDGGVSGKVFLEFVTDTLLKTLKRGDIVVMDNLASHKIVGVREAIESVGASVVYLPPYSPDLTPIENAFSKIKQELRRMRHRTKEALWQDVDRLTSLITSTDAKNFFRHCGYKLRN